MNTERQRAEAADCLLQMHETVSQLDNGLIASWPGQVPPTRSDLAAVNRLRVLQIEIATALKHLDAAVAEHGQIGKVGELLRLTHERRRCLSQVEEKVFAGEPF
jgi:hypothetical protein